jgi:hypothetical protein
VRLARQPAADGALVPALTRTNPPPPSIMWHPRSALTRFIPGMPRIPNAVSKSTTSLSGKPVAGHAPPRRTDHVPLR